MAFPVLPKPKECPTLTAAAYVGLGPPRDQNGGFIYPDFYENFMGFIQLRSSYFKEYTVQGNGYLVQGQFKAVSMQIQPIESFILFTEWSTVSG